MNSVCRLLLAAAGVFVLAASVVGQSSSSSPLSGQEIYNVQCATCHDKPESRAPDRETLKLKPRSAVLASLVSGTMSVNAKALDANENAPSPPT